MDRRNFIWGFGGFFTGCAITAAAGLSYRAYRRRNYAGPQRPPSGYGAGSDDGGWILSAEDVAQFEQSNFGLSSETLEIIPNSDLPGPSIARIQVDNAQECVTACEENSSCTRFTFARISHPEPNKRRVCWLKSGDGEINTPRAKHYISGWRKG